jgi:signal transduction histidine kinase
LLVLAGTLGAVLSFPVFGLLALRAMIGDMGFRQSAILITLAIVLATAVLAFLLWRLLLRPIRALAARAEALKSGGPVPEPLAHYGTRELRDLGESVLDMARHLHNREATVRSFTDHATHELKTPITAIRGAAEVLLDGATDEGDRQLAATILAAAGRMEDQLAALRRIAAAREGGFAGTCRLDDIAPAMQASFPALGLDINGANVALPLAPDVLSAVLQQLLGNAALHRATRVRLSATDATGGPTLTVADNGSGISPGNRARIFEPFFTTRREEGGTGMGLAIVRALIEARGGTVELLPGTEGASFLIRF